MTITLNALVAELTAQVPSRNEIPSAAQYEKAVRDAVNDFSRRCAREKITILNVVAGQASYALPEDFFSLIGFYNPTVVDGVLITPQGLVPTNGLQNKYERRTISGLTLTITPTPAYSMSYYMRYGAGWGLSGSGLNQTYIDLMDVESSILMLKAQAICLTLQLNSEAAGVLSYRIGHEQVDKTGGVQAMIAERDHLLKEYKEGCDNYNGTYTVYAGVL